MMTRFSLALGAFVLLTAPSIPATSGPAANRDSLHRPPSIPLDPSRLTP